MLEPGFAALERNAATRFGAPVRGMLRRRSRTTLLAAYEAGEDGAFFGAAAWLAAEGYYGAPGPGLGDGRLPARARRARRRSSRGTRELTTIGLAEVDDTYDVVVIGAGAGGGVAACVLAESGARVLLVERGEWLPFAEVGADHVRNHRLAVYGDNTPVAIDRRSARARGRAAASASCAASHEPGWNSNAMTVGGGTRVYGAQGWRFFPDDFRMATRYGVPDGSALADWPITYDDLAPFYEQAEWEIGVAGDGARASRRVVAAARDYPMPPGRADTSSPACSRAARPRSDGRPGRCRS